MPHANFAENVSRCHILLEVPREDSVQAELFKSIADHRLRRFRGLTVAPVRSANPVAEFSVLVLHLGMEPDAAAKPPITAQSHQQTKFVLFRRRG